MATTEVEGVTATPGAAAAAAVTTATATATALVADEIKPYTIHVSAVVILFVPPHGIPQNPADLSPFLAGPLATAVWLTRTVRLYRMRTDFFALPGPHETEARDSAAASRAVGAQVGVLVGAETSARASH